MRGKVSIADLAAARRLAERLESGAGAGRAVSAGELYALDRLEAALARVAADFVERRQPGVLGRAAARLSNLVGADEAERLTNLFRNDFALAEEGEALLGELAIWQVIDENPAARHVTGDLHNGPFRSDAARPRLGVALEDALSSGGPSEAHGESLLELLRAPARAAPDSLSGQLEFVLESWALPPGRERASVLRGLDLLAEEAKVGLPPPGPPVAEAPSFADLDPERADYSPDRDWMASTVLLAKNVNVWLHQLSLELNRSVSRLDEIPDETLDELAARGFTGLWLIGVWERSPASRRIKQLTGNPEAAASAYSVRRYRVAAELGGDAALADLARRAAARGVRLAADMVPNHMGIDSDWVLDEPQRFLSLESPPFPSYRFSGEDLSPRREIGIYLEDHYADRSDAAVVFQRVDRVSGTTRYIYHGNDGTSTPWNDTAQLDYLKEETREAVIRTIVDVAKRFPIIRFDAAMTLARRHVQRLWFPAPGTGGAIPSRAEHGLDQVEFDRLMPTEFWREVVDRLAVEAPDTLLLAEAFWLMEGYFVRSLGMHRVYNSAFMHMLRDQDNKGFRRLIKETLAFDPRILERYVNFMTNPDERTAIDQFGRGDRYFGACAVLVTLPGLPMFGHGQIEGYREKYGMEYRRSYGNETVDRELVERHRREIFPLLERRRHYAGVESFTLYDFVDESGASDENVLAYSNGGPGTASLVLFNNSPRPARGRLGRSVKTATQPQRAAEDVLGLASAAAEVWVFADLISRQTYVRPESDGLAFELGPFEYRVFERFHPVAAADSARYRELAARLGGGGVSDLARALADLELEPAADELRRLFSSPAFSSWATSPDSAAARQLASSFRRVVERLPDWACRSDARPVPEIEADLSRELGRWDKALERNPPWREERATLAAVEMSRALRGVGVPDIDWTERLRVVAILGQTLRELEVDAGAVERAVAVGAIAVEDGWVESSEAEPPSPSDWARAWLGDDRLRSLLGWHRSDGVERLRPEDLEALLRWRLVFQQKERPASDRRWAATADEDLVRAAFAGYRVDRWRELTLELDDEEAELEASRAVQPKAVSE